VNIATFDVQASTPKPLAMRQQSDFALFRGMSHPNISPIDAKSTMKPPKPQRVAEKVDQPFPTEAARTPVPPPQSNVPKPQTEVTETVDQRRSTFTTMTSQPVPPSPISSTTIATEQVQQVAPQIQMSKGMDMRAASAAQLHQFVTQVPQKPSAEKKPPFHVPQQGQTPPVPAILQQNNANMMFQAMNLFNSPRSATQQLAMLHQQQQQQQQYQHTPLGPVNSARTIPIPPPVPMQAGRASLLEFFTNSATFMMKHARTLPNIIPELKTHVQLITEAFAFSQGCRPVNPAEFQEKRVVLPPCSIHPLRISLMSP
jgi:hypothetical protein